MPWLQGPEAPALWLAASNPTPFAVVKPIMPEVNLKKAGEFRCGWTTCRYPQGADHLVISCELQVLSLYQALEAKPGGLAVESVVDEIFDGLVCCETSGLHPMPGPVSIR